MKKIKIVYLIDELYVGGTEKQLLQTLRFLDRSRFEPTLICLRSSPYLEALELECRVMVLNVVSLRSFSALRKWIGLVRWVQKERIDILQTYFFDANLFGVLAGKMSGRVRILSCRRDMGYWVTPNLLWWLKRVNPFVDRFLVNSQAIERNLSVQERVNGERVDVIPNGVDTDYFSGVQQVAVETEKKTLSIPAASLVVGMTANLNRPVKRVELFIRAAGRVHAELPQAYFLVLGDGKLKPDLEALAKREGVEHNVIFLGLREDFLPYLAMMDVGCLTSDSEGFPNAILEYMAAGLPVVAPAVGGVGELVQDDETGFLVPTGDVEAVASAILRLLKNAALRETFGNRARKIVEQEYAWERIVERFQAYYVSILENRP